MLNTVLRKGLFAVPPGRTDNNCRSQSDANLRWLSAGIPDVRIYIFLSVKSALGRHNRYDFCIKFRVFSGTCAFCSETIAAEELKNFNFPLTLQTEIIL